MTEPDDDRPIHVLVVDDLATNRRLLDASLTPRGFTVTTASSGAEALELLDVHDVDVVVLDVNMPGMSGYEVCRRIRETPRTHLLPVVMVTAAPEEERVLAIEAEADDFLRRPLDKAELLARVRSLARLKRYHDASERHSAELHELNETLEHRVHDQLLELERLRVLRRFLSPQVAEAMFEADDFTVLEPHRKEVAVLAWQLRGLAGVSSSAGPEEELSVLETFHEMLGRLLGEHGATVGAFDGESVMAFFGDPADDPDHVGHALRLAVALRDEGQALAGEHARRGHAVRTTIGVALGYATLGRIGFEGRLDYGAIGPVVTRARHLCELAAGGEVLLDQRTCGAAGDLVEVGEARRIDAQGDHDALDVLPLVRVTTPEAAASIAASLSSAPTVPMQLDLRVLGPLEVLVDGTPVAITAARERALLALLIANHGRTIRVGHLAEDLWEGSPPESASAALRVNVSRLRNTLAAAGLEGLVLTRPSGYLLDVPAEAVDITRFDAGVTEARAAALEGRPDDAVRIFRDALALWRGTALAEVSGSSFVTSETIRLEQSRLVAQEECLAAELACGHHRAVLPELEALVHDEPLREQFWELYLLALYRSGRQPDALRAFQDMRRILGDELGLDPSPELVDLEKALVAHDASLQWSGAEAVT